MKRRLMLAGALALGASLSANSFLTNATVQSQVDPQGQGADACQHAGVTVLRQNFPNEAAIQLGGSNPADPSRIYTRPGAGSFFLTDAGSQWASAVNQSQVVLAVLETVAGQHDWTGADYAGAEIGTVTKPDIVRGQLSLNDVLMTRLPSPLMVTATTSAISLSIPGSADPSGQGSGLRLWRRRSDIPVDPWQSVSDLAWSSGAQAFTDTGIQANYSYQYGVSFIYQWPGGQGAGADPSVLNQYITIAKGLSVPIFASSVQPTPTPFPTLPPAPVTPDLGQEAWIAYPNPLIGSALRLAFKTEKDRSQYWLSIYALDGTKVFGFQGQADNAGWQKPIMDLNKLASGVYLLRLRILQPGLDEKVLPVRKLAIIK